MLVLEWLCGSFCPGDGEPCPAGSTHTRVLGLTMLLPIVEDVPRCKAHEEELLDMDGGDEDDARAAQDGE